MSLSELPMLREILVEPCEYSGDDKLEYRMIFGLKRIDWHKYFEKQTTVHDLVKRAANSIPNSPIGFLRPDWVNRPLQEYLPSCPQWAKDYTSNFALCAKNEDFKGMEEWWGVIQNRI
jgi:hypothetical protein